MRQWQVQFRNESSGSHDFKIGGPLLLVTAWVIANFSVASALAQTNPWPVGSQKQLFFDDRFIAESENVRIVMNQPRKLGPVLKPDSRWEDFRFTSYFTVVQEGDLCRMYYSCFSEDQWNFAEAEVTWRDYAFLCYAESKDGIHWHKPNLGIVEYDGSTDNNILARSIVDGTVFIDPNDVPERRYKLIHTVGPHQGGLRISCSADGIHFKLAEKPVVLWGPDSQQNMFFDTRRGKIRGVLACGSRTQGCRCRQLANGHALRIRRSL